MESSNRNLAVVSILYLVSAAVGTTLAVVHHLPAQFGGILNGNDVPADFVTIGTGLSAPLFLLAAQSVLTVLLVPGGNGVRAGVAGLTVLGVCYTLGQLGEPILYRALNPATFDPVVAAVAMCNLVFSVAISVLGVSAWRGTHSAYARGEARS